MTEDHFWHIPVCVCHHPLDAHDPKSGSCMGVNVSGCSCEQFVDSGRKQKIPKGTTR